MSRRYRHRCRILRDESADGAQAPDYQILLAQIPCRILPKSSYESSRGAQLEAGVSHVIEMRYYADFLPNDIVEDEHKRDRRLHIKGVIDVGGVGRTTELHCSEVVV